MRMFLYYALHSFVNQIKKLFKTWVMVFIIVCFVFGMGIGLFAVTLSNLAEKNKEETKITETVDAPKEKKPYDLIWISLVTLGLYAVTLILVKTGRMKLAVHRKIWNFLLLITFLVSCLLGFFLVIQINYHLAWDALATIRYYHVQFGIAMTIVAMLHVLWHIPYFKTYFKKKKGE